MNYKIKVNGTEYKVHIRRVENTRAYLTVNDEDFEVEVEGLVVNPTRMSIKTTPKPILKPVPVAEPVKKTAIIQSNHQVKPPLPGVILDICVEEGMQVKKGQILYVLEAMKMENHIESDYNGIVEKIHRSKGEPVLESDVILVIK
ncbi:MAG: biotin/lipoyl-binding protein [Tannerella sp.]|jgi:biotin carboxyl carrier protein|nr:biotin/lipoyl-binding protein [Tannerella sp.]